MESGRFLKTKPNQIKPKHSLILEDSNNKVLGILNDMTLKDKWRSAITETCMEEEEQSREDYLFL